MEKRFVFLDEAVCGVRWDARYASGNNFTGGPVDGYGVNRVVGTYALAEALRAAGEKAAALGFGLLLWDGYRPARAVRHFLRWAAQPEDGRTKARFYPNISRGDMVAKGYVAAESSHSRGSAIDLTIWRLRTGAPVPMGTDFDYMDERSHHGAAAVSGEAADNRRLLRAIMESSGFAPYAREWWHYALTDEPYPDTYFDFPIA